MDPFYKNKRVLVTGGAGFIGSNLAHRLLREGARVTIVDAFIPGSGANLFNIESALDQIRLERVDLNFADQLSDLIADQEIVFHLAGQGSHKESMQDPFFDHRQNLTTTLSLLEVCRKRNPNVTIVFSSTRQMYGRPQYQPVDEEHPINPPDVNAIHKLASESYLRLYSKVYGMKTISLRLTNTYGPRQYIKSARHGFIGWFLNRALTGQPIELFGGGDQVRDFTFVDDAVEAFLCAASHEACYGETFNLSGEKASLKEIAQILISLAGRGEVKIVAFPDAQKAIDIGDFTASSKKFESASGWKRDISLSEGLRQTFEYYQKNSSKYLSPRASRPTDASSEKVLEV